MRRLKQVLQALNDCCDCHFQYRRIYIGQSILCNGYEYFRLIIIMASAFFGLFGFYIRVFILLYTANMRVLGVPYINFSADFEKEDVARSLLRPSPKGYSKRPVFLKPQDRTRTSEKISEIYCRSGI